MYLLWVCLLSLCHPRALPCLGVWSWAGTGALRSPGHLVGDVGRALASLRLPAPGPHWQRTLGCAQEGDRMPMGTTQSLAHAECEQLIGSPEGRVTKGGHPPSYIVLLFTVCESLLQNGQELSSPSPAYSTVGHLSVDSSLVARGGVLLWSNRIWDSATVPNDYPSTASQSCGRDSHSVWILNLLMVSFHVLHST